MSRKNEELSPYIQRPFHEGTFYLPGQCPPLRSLPSNYIYYYMSFSFGLLSFKVEMIIFF